MRRCLLLALVVAFTTSALASRPEGSPLAPRPSPLVSDNLKDVLRRAGQWIQRFADDAVYVVAEERYEQQYRRKDGTTEQRRLLSEMVLVRTPDEEARAGYSWVQLRDVIEVDGAPLPEHRGRLEALFRQAGGSGYAQAAAMIQESARYNIGPGIRTVNVPSFALFFLHPGNQKRCRFEIRGQEVAFRERARPTMIRSPKREDLPASGTFWIEPSSGRVLKTRLEVQVDRHWAMTTDVNYGYEAGIDAWMPQTMHEHFGGRTADESLDCTATYSRYRRFRTSGRVINR